MWPSQNIFYIVPLCWRSTGHRWPKAWCGRRPPRYAWTRSCVHSTRPAWTRRWTRKGCWHTPARRLARRGGCNYSQIKVWAFIILHLAQGSFLPKIQILQYGFLVINYDYNFGSPFPLQLSLAEIGRLDNSTKHSEPNTDRLTDSEHRFWIAIYNVYILI